MRALLGFALAVGLAAAATADDKKDLPVDGKKLIGKWEPKEAKKDLKTAIEFTKDGKLVLTVEPAGKKPTTIDGTYKLDGNKLRMKLKLDRKEVDEEAAVLRLTDAELETEDAKGKKETLTRVRATK